jgi:hypothetical protein
MGRHRERVKLKANSLEFVSCDANASRVYGRM